LYNTNYWGKVTRGGSRKTLETPPFLRYYIEVRVFKNTWFNRFAGKEGITDNELLEIVNKLEAKQSDANLGGDVYKMRVARAGEGKSGGNRIIVYFRSEYRTIFAYGFAKSARDNIDEKDLKRFKIRAKDLFSLTDDQIDVLVKNGTLIEITEEEE
jgi:hypothetical protein